jgi:hypothetical protein
VTLVLFDDVLILGKYSSKKQRTATAHRDAGAVASKGFVYKVWQLNCYCCRCMLMGGAGALAAERSSGHGPAANALP